MNNSRNGPPRAKNAVSVNGHLAFILIVEFSETSGKNRKILRCQGEQRLSIDFGTPQNVRSEIGVPNQTYVVPESRRKGLFAELRDPKVRPGGAVAPRTLTPNVALRA